MRVRLPPIRRMPTDVCTSWVQAGGGDWEPIWDRFLPQSCKEAENRKDFVVGSGLDERQQVGARTSSIHSERVGISRSTPDGRSALLPPPLLLCPLRLISSTLGRPLALRLSPPLRLSAYSLFAAESIPRPAAHPPPKPPELALPPSSGRVISARPGRFLRRLWRHTRPGCTKTPSPATELVLTDGHPGNVSVCIRPRPDPRSWAARPTRLASPGQPTTLRST